MKNVAFTIVAKNYIGLAMVLEKSVRATTPDTDFFIFVADEFTAGDKEALDLPANVLFAKEKTGINEKLWNEMAFKYNLVEFCTAIKPHCFKYFLSQMNCSKVVYLDPDIFVFNSLEPIYAELDRCSILVTPHISDMYVPFESDHPDYLFLVNGIFNLGFLGVANTPDTNKMINWWQDRLYHQCFFDDEKGMATDQKWMNMLPGFFAPGVLNISRNLGFNVGPWNLFERKIITSGNNLFVINRYDQNDAASWPLVFVHFSGYDYRSLSNNVVSHKNDSLAGYPDMAPVFERYAGALQDDSFKKYIHLRYTYNFFRNGKNIISINRRIFRRLVDERGNIYADPFDTGENSYYSKLKKCRLIDHSTTSVDSFTNKNISGFKGKLRLVNFVFKTVQRIIGIRRYSIVARFFKRYFIEENQYFLYDSNTEKDFY